MASIQQVHRPRASAPHPSHDVRGRLLKVLRSNLNNRASFNLLVVTISRATPGEIIELERNGVPKALSKHMCLDYMRQIDILGAPKAAAARKGASRKTLAGAPGYAAIGILRLLSITKEILSASTSAEAKHFDGAKWLGRWIERAQPVPGGRKPADYLDTPTGVKIVERLLGSLESGAYQ